MQCKAGTCKARWAPTRVGLDFVHTGRVVLARVVLTVVHVGLTAVTLKTVQAVTPGGKQSTAASECAEEEEAIKVLSNILSR